MRLYTRANGSSIAACLAFAILASNVAALDMQGALHKLDDIIHERAVAILPRQDSTATNLPDLDATTAATAAATDAAATTQQSDTSASATSASGTQTGTASTTGSAFHLTGLPTLAGAGIPEIKVPNTNGAPFMQKSNMPEGTVFIVVGAILGFLGMSVLAWRGLVAWSLHRSVKRAASAQNIAETHTKMRGPYAALGASGSNLALDQFTSPNPMRNKHASAITTHATPSKTAQANPSTTSLFFSPTANATQQSQNRASSYLPSGYYSTSNATPNAGFPTAHLGAGNQSPGLSPAGNRASYLKPSPPGSPMLPPARGQFSDDSSRRPSSFLDPSASTTQLGATSTPARPNSYLDRPSNSRDGPSPSTPGYGQRNSTAAAPGATRTPSYAGLGANSGEGLSPSSSVFNLNQSGYQQSGGRAPSAYLEDLFENHGNGPRERY